MSYYDQLVEAVVDGGYLPEFLLRRGIRAQLQDRINIIASTSLEQAYETKMRYVDSLRRQPIAIETAKATSSTTSCCLYPKGTETLAQAEMAMLELYVERAGLRDGMKVFDLGCGWGSLSLYLAERFAQSEIVAFSNSTTQKAFIDAQAAGKGLRNLRVVTGDVATFAFRGSEHEGVYDRVLSVELFEHMKNYERLLAKVAGLLRPGAGAKLFVHLFCHRSTPYDFESGWMTQHFFTGGTMPSADLLHFFQRDLRLERQWWVNGRHYARTCNEWLRTMERNRGAIWPHLEATYGVGFETGRWFRRWQVFYMACAELFAWEGGECWGVGHYLFEKP
ncbi:(S)-coclaurine N-methyltransferase [Teratosphaeria destructans]|uniref:(S)-coclaurine N-methyltransferase n=1 Tax=Teratosphaeria destructans TaxID=418781 RepID=A0A9W7ST78_9PEZI|nr:(S)-coclaurine N-methyltransferase [Teratosphaeria destructans]